MTTINLGAQLHLPVGPTEDSHAVRKIDVTPVFLTKAELAALEDPPDSGLYPTLVGRTVVVTDEDMPVAGNGAYGMTERPTGETWIDGKPIYRRTFSGAVTKPTALNTAIRTSITSFDNVSSFVRYEGHVRAGSTNWVHYGLPYAQRYSNHQTNAATLLDQYIIPLCYLVGNRLDVGLDTSSGHLSYLGDVSQDWYYNITLYYTKV
jgi:hypothetical protein